MREPPEIIQLSDQVANQIAAGEVIERPAAVVKELVENSIDAGSQRITVRIEDGGRRLIEIIDDGHGMRKEDLRRAVGRHATSKLKAAEDLFRIATLGFRGEALPSIASVSELTLASRPHSEEAGWMCSMRAGSETGFEPCGMGPGTRISVRNLFWNVPARLKFLKAEAAETGHITDQMLRFALSHPEVGFRLEHGTSVLVDRPPKETLIGRIGSLFGRQMADGLIPVHYESDAIRINGFIAHPREARATAKRQYIFLNGRFLKDRLLIAALREGYAGFMEPRLHAAVFMHADVDPDGVDVNVHPTKAEVRFRREGEIFSATSSAIKSALAGQQGGFPLVPTPSAPQPQAPAIVSRTVVKSAGEPAVQERFLPFSPAASEPVLREPRQDQAAVSVPAAKAAEAHAGYTSEPATSQRAYKRVWQVRDSFLIIETWTGIRMVDQHALHEKALFLLLDEERTDFTRGGQQTLIMPQIIELGAAEVAAITPMCEALRSVGIDVEASGAANLALRAFPAMLRRCRWQQFFTDLAESGHEQAIGRLRQTIAHRLACHAAVKANQSLTLDEQQELADLLFRMDGLEHCPHGRPTTLDLGWSELERRFQR